MKKRLQMNWTKIFNVSIMQKKILFVRLLQVKKIWIKFISMFCFCSFIQLNYCVWFFLFFFCLHVFVGLILLWNRIECCCEMHLHNPELYIIFDGLFSTLHRARDTFRTIVLVYSFVNVCVCSCIWERFAFCFSFYGI